MSCPDVNAIVSSCLLSFDGPLMSPSSLPRRERAIGAVAGERVVAVMQSTSVPNTVMPTILPKSSPMLFRDLGSTKAW